MGEAELWLLPKGRAEQEQAIQPLLTGTDNS